MTRIQMIKYGKWTYPDDIPLTISEVAGHFDKEHINSKMDYSLHTEYSFGERKFSSKYLAGLNEITGANYKGIPQLWHSKKWAEEFAEYIFRLCNNHQPPKIIEVHPPFCDYCSDFKNFTEIYKVFEQLILEKYPNVQILIENRCGSKYKKSDFLFSKAADFFTLCEEIEREQLNLRIAFDIPQLFTAEQIVM